MTTYSVADAKNNLSELIERARQGEGVVITRHGVPVAELRPLPAPARPIEQADLDWLAAQMLRPAHALAQDAGELVAAMRDEDCH
jgi:prevent-host-death family protein